jgi:hypothetical protein
MRLALLVLLALLPTAASAQLGPPREGSYHWRVLQASRLLQRPLARLERISVIQAHRVGRGEAGNDGTPARLYNYTFGQLKQKVRVLKDVGFTPLERRRLIMSGLCGSRGPPSPKTRR